MWTPALASIAFLLCVDSAHTSYRGPLYANQDSDVIESTKPVLVNLSHENSLNHINYGVTSLTKQIDVIDENIKVRITYGHQKDGTGLSEQFTNLATTFEEYPLSLPLLERKHRQLLVQFIEREGATSLEMSESFIVESQKRMMDTLLNLHDDVVLSCAGELASSSVQDYNDRLEGPSLKNYIESATERTPKVQKALWQATNRIERTNIVALLKLRDDMSLKVFSWIWRSHFHECDVNEDTTSEFEENLRTLSTMPDDTRNAITSYLNVDNFKHVYLASSEQVQAQLLFWVTGLSQPQMMSYLESLVAEPETSIEKIIVGHHDFLVSRVMWLVGDDILGKILELTDKDRLTNVLKLACMPSLKPILTSLKGFVSLSPNGVEKVLELENSSIAPLFAVLDTTSQNNILESQKVELLRDLLTEISKTSNASLRPLTTNLKLNGGAINILLDMDVETAYQILVQCDAGTQQTLLQSNRFDSCITKNSELLKTVHSVRITNLCGKLHLTDLHLYRLWNNMGPLESVSVLFQADSESRLMLFNQLRSSHIGLLLAFLGKGDCQVLSKDLVGKLKFPDEFIEELAARSNTNSIFNALIFADKLSQKAITTQCKGLTMDTLIRELAGKTMPLHIGGKLKIVSTTEGYSVTVEEDEN